MVNVVVVAAIIMLVFVWLHTSLNHDWMEKKSVFLFFIYFLHSVISSDRRNRIDILNCTNFLLKNEQIIFIVIVIIKFYPYNIQHSQPLLPQKRNWSTQWKTATTTTKWNQRNKNERKKQYWAHTRKLKWKWEKNTERSNRNE